MVHRNTSFLYGVKKLSGWHCNVVPILIGSVVQCSTLICSDTHTGFLLAQHLIEFYHKDRTSYSKETLLDLLFRLLFFPRRLIYLVNFKNYAICNYTDLLLRQCKLEDYTGLRLLGSPHFLC